MKLNRYTVAGVILILITCFTACMKESDILSIPQYTTAEEVYEKCQEKDIDITLREIEVAMANPAIDGECFTALDLLTLLEHYGKCAPNYVIGWNNYFQDANCNIAQWQFFVGEVGPDSTASIITVQPDSVVWTIDDIDNVTMQSNLLFQTYTSGGIPAACSVGEYQPQCNGAHSVTATGWFGGSSYVRSGISYGLINNVPPAIPTCELGPFDVENTLFYDFQCQCPITFETYEMLDVAYEGMDFDGNGCVNSIDLLYLLARYSGNC